MLIKNKDLNMSLDEEFDVRDFWAILSVTA